MKTLLTIILLTISIQLVGQNFEEDSSRVWYYKIEKQNKFKSVYLPLILMTSSITLNAVGDGLNDNNKKLAGHLCNSLSIASLLTIPFSCDIEKKKWPIYAMSYVTLRVGLFDPIYNSVRKLPINYIGNQSLTDKFWKEEGVDLFTRSWFFGIGVVIPISELGKK
jgi:hypothetical protein